jgi:hypothetical protein
MEDTTIQNDQSTQDQQTAQAEPVTETTPRQRRRSFGDRLLEAELLAAGIANHLETLTANGVRPDILESLQAVVQATKSVNEEQEKYKGDLRDCTTRLQEAVKDMNRVVREGQQYVKWHIPQALWLEFGMKQTR